MTITREQMIEWLNRGIHMLEKDHPECEPDDLPMAQAIRDELSKQSGNGWQPIETAPRDEQYVLGATYYQNGKFCGMAVMCFCDGRWQSDGIDWDFTGKDDDKFSDIPTHWMRLPEAPKEEMK